MKSKYIRIERGPIPKNDPPIRDEPRIDTALSRKDPQQRLEAVDRLSDPSALETIALNDPDSSVRAEAILKVTDPETLRLAALNDSSERVSLRAVLRISDEATLKEVIQKSFSPRVSMAAEFRLMPPEDVAEIIDNDNNSADMRLIAIRSLSDRALLRRIATTYPGAVYRQAAKLNYERLAANNADSEESGVGGLHAELKNPDPQVRIKAVQQLNDEDLLVETAAWDKDPDVRVAAVERITDQEFLAAGPMLDRENRVRLAALARLTKPELIQIAARKNNDEYVRIAAIERVTNQDVIIRAAISDLDHRVRNAALRKVRADRQDIFYKSAAEDREPGNFRLAIERLTDPELQHKILNRHSDWRRRLEVLKKIDDPEELKQIEAENDSPHVCFAAAEKRSERDPDSVAETFLRLLKNPDTPFKSALRIADFLRNRYKKSDDEKIRAEIRSIFETDFYFILRSDPGDYLNPVRITAVKSFRFHLRASPIQPVNVLTDRETLESIEQNHPDSLSFLDAVRSLIPAEEPRKKRRARYRPRQKYPEN